MSADPGPIWYIDLAGIVVDQRVPGSGRAFPSSFGSFATQAKVLRSPMEFIYSRAVVDFINRASDHYEIRWLTNLTKWVPNVVAPGLGLKSFGSAGTYGFERHATSRPTQSGAWWKDGVVREEIGASGRRFVWTDDRFTSRVVNSLREDCATNQCLLLPIDPGSVLSVDARQQISDFVGGIP